LHIARFKDPGDTYQSLYHLASLHLALIDADDLVEHVERLVARALEGVAADDRTIGAAVAQAADLGEQAFEVLGRVDSRRRSETMDGCLWQ
jgi:hypothetical protein